MTILFRKQNGVMNGNVSFYPIDNNPNVLRGQFLANIHVNGLSGEITIMGYEWVSKPDGYWLVPSVGHLSADGRRLEGLLDGDANLRFSLTRQ